MWNEKNKAVTFSYDDGVEMDIRLKDIFNHYGLKATFNLNSGLASGANSFYKSDICVKRMNIDRLPDIYKGHEVAVHCLTHADLPKFDDETVRNEILQDKLNLERIFGEEMVGMAYPFGTFDTRVKKIVKECGIRYARTVIETGACSLSEDLLELKTSAHHDNPNILGLVEGFLQEETLEPRLLYIWGHSYEFEEKRNWEHIEKICKMLSGHDDIFYGTNKEVLLVEGIKFLE